MTVVDRPFYGMSAICGVSRLLSKTKRTRRAEVRAIEWIVRCGGGPGRNSSARTKAKGVT
jgi:hypothetical protein